MIKELYLPVIPTSHLMLRALKMEDQSNIFKMRNDECMHLHTDTKPDVDMSDTIRYLNQMILGVDQKKWLIWAIEDIESKRVIGTISLWNFSENTAEFGYGMIPEFQGRGLMKEALQAVISYAFDHLNLESLFAYTEVNNVQSKHLLDRCGFKQVDLITEQGYTQQRMFSMLVYQRNRECSIKNLAS